MRIDTNLNVETQRESFRYPDEVIEGAFDWSRPITPICVGVKVDASVDLPGHGSDSESDSKDHCINIHTLPDVSTPDGVEEAFRLVSRGVDAIYESLNKLHDDGKITYDDYCHRMRSLHQLIGPENAESYPLRASPVQDIPF